MALEITLLCIYLLHQFGSIWSHKSAVFKEIQKTLCKSQAVGTRGCVTHVESCPHFWGSPTSRSRDVSGGSRTQKDAHGSDPGIIYVIPKDRPASLHSLGLQARQRLRSAKTKVDGRGMGSVLAWVLTRKQQ